MNKRLVAVLAMLLITSAFVSAQTVVPAQYFGMHYVKTQPWPTISFGSLRLWDTDTRWQQMNPASGVYDFSNLDAYLALAYSHSVFDVVLVLGATPNWISSDPSNTVCDYASISPGSCAPPLDLNSDGTGTDQTWRSFVYAVASHVTTLNPAVYSKVTTYEMWNEFSRNTESWTGSQAQMLRMSEDAHCIVKGSGAVTATGEACVAQAFLIPAVGVAPNSMMASPSAQASAPDVNVLGVYFSSPGATGSVDVIASHDYTYGASCCASPETLVSQWRMLQAVLPESARGLAAWSTEGSWGDTATKEPDPDMQSAYVARAYLLGWSAGFRRMYWYAWGNSWGRLWSQSGVNGCNDQGSGTGCVSPAAQAYASVYAWMVGNVMSRPCTASGSVYSCPIKMGQGYALAVWDASMTCAHGWCSHSSFSVPAGYGSYRDLANARHNFKGHGISIGAKPVLLLSNTDVNAGRVRNKPERQSQSRLTQSRQSQSRQQVSIASRTP